MQTTKKRRRIFQTNDQTGKEKKQEKKTMLFIKLARIIFYAFVVYFQCPTVCFILLILQQKAFIHCKNNKTKAKRLV